LEHTGVVKSCICNKFHFKECCKYDKQYRVPFYLVMHCQRLSLNTRSTDHKSKSQQEGGRSPTRSSGFQSEDVQSISFFFVFSLINHGPGRNNGSLPLGLPLILSTDLEPTQTTPEPLDRGEGTAGVKRAPLVVKGLKCRCKGRVT